MPLSQFEQRADPPVENVPAPQGLHVPIDAAPSFEENLPASQLSQVDLDDEATIVENVPGSHGVHSEEPGFAEYLPATQLEHSAAED